METGLSFSSNVVSPPKLIGSDEKRTVAYGVMPLSFSNFAYLGWSGPFWPDMGFPKSAWSLPTFPIPPFAPTTLSVSSTNSKSTDIPYLPVKPVPTTSLDFYSYADTKRRDFDGAARSEASSIRICNPSPTALTVPKRLTVNKTFGETTRSSSGGSFGASGGTSPRRIPSCTNVPNDEQRNGDTRMSQRDECFKGEVHDSAKSTVAFDHGRLRCEEKPFLKFGVQAILAKSDTGEAPLTQLPLISSTRGCFPEHLNILPTSDLPPPAAIASQPCRYVTPNTFLAPHGSLLNHANRSVLPCWLPTTIRGKNRRGMLRRAVFSDMQRKALEKKFQQHKYIGKPDRKKLATKLGLKDSQVKIWFQNRRMKWRNSKEKQILSSMDLSKKDEAKNCDDVLYNKGNPTSPNNHEQVLPEPESAAATQSVKAFLSSKTTCLMEDDTHYLTPLSSTT